MMNARYLDNTYKRYHEGDYKCTPDEVRRMFADADVEHPRDSKILPEFSIEGDIDIESLNQYRRLVAAIKPSHAWLLLDNKSFLTKLGGYRVDRREKIEGLTLAGLLMFGKTDSITDSYCCPSYFPDYREYLDPDPNSRWTDRVCPDGVWEANLFQFYIRVFQKLSLALPKPFTLKDGIRMDETPTHVALREAFFNTLVHADYLVDSNITIELWRDKYVFSNPGSLLISFSQYWKGGDSVCRNKSLLQMLFRLIAAGNSNKEIGEKLCMKLDAVKAMRKYLLDKFLVISDNENSMRAVIRALRMGLIKLEEIEDLMSDDIISSISQA